MWYPPLLDALGGLWLIFAVPAAGLALVVLIAWAIAYGRSEATRRFCDRGAAIAFFALVTVLPLAALPIFGERMTSAQVERVCAPPGRAAAEPLRFSRREIAAAALPAAYYADTRMELVPVRGGWIGGYMGDSAQYTLVLVSLREDPRSERHLAVRGFEQRDFEWWSVRDERLFVGSLENGAQIEERDAALGVIHREAHLGWPVEPQPGGDGALYFPAQHSHTQVRLWRIPPEGRWTSTVADFDRVSSYRADVRLRAASGGVCLAGERSGRGEFFAGDPPRPASRPWSEILGARFGPTWPALVLALAMAALALARAARPFVRAMALYRASAQEGWAVCRDGAWFWIEDGGERPIRGAPEIELWHGRAAHPAQCVALLGAPLPTAAAQYREPAGPAPIELRALIEGTLHDARRARRDAVFARLPRAALWLGFVGVASLLVVLGHVAWTLFGF